MILKHNVQVSASIDHSDGFLMFKVVGFDEEEELNKILEWMNPSDAVQSQEFFFSKITTPGTGEWLLKGDKYNEWKITPNSFLWLQGDGRFNYF